jgi:hypothetical protein
MTLSAMASAASRNGSTSERSFPFIRIPQNIESGTTAPIRPHFPIGTFGATAASMRLADDLEAAHVDVELVLGPDDGGVGD